MPTDAARGRLRRLLADVGARLCTVEADVADRALRRQGKVVQLGTWSGTLRGRADDWTLWWARGVPWASTSDVDGGEQILLLIDRWQAEVAQAQARGQRWDPLPPGVGPGTGAGAARAAAPGATAPARRAARAVAHAVARAPSEPHMIAVIAGGDEDRGADVREQMTRSAALLFGERGFSGTGLRDVIAHSSTPRGSIYHHFAGGKAELAREAVEHAAGVVAGRVGDAARDGDPIVTLHAWLDHWRYALERSDFRAGSAVLAVAAEPEEQTGARAAAAAAFEDWADAFAATLQRRRRAGARRRRGSPRSP